MIKITSFNSSVRCSLLYLQKKKKHSKHKEKKRIFFFWPTGPFTFFQIICQLPRGRHVQVGFYWICFYFFLLLSIHNRGSWICLAKFSRMKSFFIFLNKTSLANERGNEDIFICCLFVYLFLLLLLKIEDSLTPILIFTAYLCVWQFHFEYVLSLFNCIPSTELNMSNLLCWNSFFRFLSF